MKKALKLATSKSWYFFEGKKIAGVPPDLIGDVTGLRGDVSGLIGDVDQCELSDEERAEGIDVKNLIGD